MKFGDITATSAELYLGDGGDQIITIHCEDVSDDVFMVARAVNLFPALVSALTPFRSSEMGNLLVGLVDMREETGAEIQKRLSHLISMIDVILDAAEREYDDIDA
jgi:hypothetical protein